MASIFRTSSMAVSKKSSQHKSITNNGSVKEPKTPTHKMNGYQSRRNTLHPRARDSVLSTGSSDRSSSISDEALLSPPVGIDDHHSLLYTRDMDHLVSFDIDEKIGEAWPVKCRFVVREILQTEIAYVRSLGDIVKGYLKPLYSHLLNSGESPNFIKTVFSNIVKIHHSHIELMECFQETCMCPCDFVSCFIKFDFLSLYTVYCTSYSQGNECLEKSLADNPQLKEFIEQCQREVGHSLPLSSQLIKPVQRILKYRLLLEELLKNFDPKHSHHTAIIAALDKMAAVAEQINTSFTKPRGASKALPSAVAKKRTHQIRDLQKSRSSKNRKSTSPSPVHSTKLQYRCTSESHLNASDGNHTNYGLLRNGQVLGTSVQCVNGNHGAWTLPSRNGNCSGDELDLRLAKSPSELGVAKTLTKTLPSVSRLRNFFENLNKEEESETQDTENGALKRAVSLADTRTDPVSGQSLVSLSSPNKLSPKPQRRRSSLSSADGKFGGSGSRRKEKSPSPFPTQRRSSVEDDIKRHIQEVRARKAQRTMF